MVHPTASFQRSEATALHVRRVRLTLWFGSALLVAQGIGWGLFFGLHGDWHIVALDLAMLSVGVAIGFLTYRHRTRTAFFLLLGSMFVVVCGISLFLDVPSPAAPRSTHHFLLVLTMVAVIFLRDERWWLRMGLTGLCLVAFVVLASSALDVQTAYALPDNIRVPGTWANNIGSAFALYVLINVMIAEISEHASMEVDLRKGLRRGEFFLLYQPQVDSSGRVFGAEALVRWKHPTLGLVRPDNFIPVAEKTGLILPLGAWVLGAACAELVSWSKRPSMQDLTLSVNVSVHQFLQADFVEQVTSTLERTGAKARYLKLELTESSLVQDMDDIIAKMKALKALGVGFSLDDFGTGYSSLSYLKRLPLDQLKIDQSFVRDVLTDEHDASIAKMVINLGKSLGFNVIAEGVETHEQRAFLMANDCHSFQGYLFSKPITAAQYVQYAVSTER